MIIFMNICVFYPMIYVKYMLYFCMHRVFTLIPFEMKWN